MATLLPPNFPGVERKIPLDPRDLAHLEQNDFGIVQRYIRRYGDTCRYVPNAGWMAYAKTHWVQDKYVAECAMVETIAQIRDEASALTLAGDEDRAKPLRSFALKGAPRVSRVLQCLRLAEGHMRAELDEFDRDPLALNVQNGTLRFKRSDDGSWRAELDPHAPADMITRIANAAYDPTASAPHWAAHLERMQPDAALRAYLKRILGYCALGLTREQAFFIFQGRGGDGKSTTVNAVRHVLGSYADVGDVTSFLMSKSQRGGDAATPALASLRGDTRLVSTSEPPRGSELNDGLLKNLTGGSPIKVRQLHKELFAYSPRWKLIMECNGLPRISGVDDGIWRRVHLLYWCVQLARAEMDSELEAKLRDESAGILNWLVEGALDYLQNGLAPPVRAVEDLANFRSGANVFGDWVENRLIREARALCPQKELRADYVRFCEDGGHEPMSVKAFTDELTSHQILRQNRLSTGGRNVMRSGARLRTPEDDARLSCEADEDPYPFADEIPLFQA